MVFKNQFKIIWKKWFSFIGIFILILLSIILTNSALSASSNLNNVNNSLKQSNMYQYSVRVDNRYFSEQGFRKIESYFYPGKTLTLNQKLRIYRNEVLPVDKHQDEIEKWNYNFQAWMINQVSSTYFPDNKVAVDYSVNTSVSINNNNFNVTLANGFNDGDWNFVNSHGIKENKYNLKTSNLVYLTQGRMPTKNNEVVVSISVNNQNNPNFKIGNTITINNQDYQIVGRGYNYSSYLASDQTQTTVWMNNSIFNQLWINRDAYNNSGAEYYVNLQANQIDLFKTLIAPDYLYFSSYSISNNFNDLDENVPLRLVSLETFLFTTFGFIVFAVTIIIVIIFLKKDISRQSGSLGILMGLGTKPKVLSFNLALAYLSLLIMPLVIGFGISFALQFYLTHLISKIIFFPFPLIGIFTVPTIISLIIFPVILIASLVLIIYFLLNKPALQLISQRPKNKHHKMKETQSQPLIKNFINFRLTLSFAKSNKLRIWSTLTIFIVNFFLILFLLSLINVYNYSSSFFEKQYTSYGNRMFNQTNPTIDDLFKAMKNKQNFDDQTSHSFSWVSNQDFVAGQGTKYTEVNLNNIVTIDDWYDTYLTPNTVKTVAENPEMIKPYVSSNFYQLFLQMSTIWKNNNAYPYLTNGFKIYQTDNSLVATKLSAKWNSNRNSANYFNFEGYKNSEFPKWIYFQGENTQQALTLINQANNNYVNAVLPLGLAKQLNVTIGDTLSSQVNVSYGDDEIWAKIPVHVVGINDYNYFDNKVIVNQQLLYKFLLKEYQNINPSVTINISNYDIFLNNMLVKDKTPEISRNISLYSYNKDYSNFNNLQLNGDFQYYTSTNYSDTMVNIDQYIGDLIKGLETLIATVLIIVAIVILILISLVFSENKNNIISLKFLGYNNLKIANFLLLPYIIGFVGFTLIVTALVYLALTPTLSFLLSATGVVLLFNFSWVLWLILIASISALMVIAFSIGWIQIMKSKIGDLQLLE